MSSDQFFTGPAPVTILALPAHTFPASQTFPFPACITGVNLVAYDQALTPKASPMWSDQFFTGPAPVTIACTYIPSIANIDNRPFLISLIFNSANVSASSAKPNGSKLSPGYNESKPSPV